MPHCRACNSILGKYEIGICNACKAAVAPDPKPDYEKAYGLLMDFWDRIPEDERGALHKKLKECGV